MNKKTVKNPESFNWLGIIEENNESFCYEKSENVSFLRDTNYMLCGSILADGWVFQSGKRLYNKVSGFCTKGKWDHHQAGLSFAERRSDVDGGFAT